MDDQINDFKENIIKKYDNDIKNIFMIEDYLIAEDLKECDELIEEIFNKNKEEKLNTKNSGYFSIIINEKFLLISKRDLNIIFSKIYKFLLFITKNLDSFKQFIFVYIKELFSLINLVLLFNDNITFYSLKKKILLLNVNKDYINTIKDILLNEYYFTCLTNKKLRKSAISWDYKYFLFDNFKNNIFTKENFKKNNSEYIFDLLKNELVILGLGKEIIFDNIFIQNDLKIINEINIFQSRNCHMWAYLRKVYNKITKEEKIIIILYAFIILRKCNFDYSAFSFIVNSKKNMPLNKEQIEKLISEIKKVSIIKYDDHRSYIDNLEKYLF